MEYAYKLENLKKILQTKKGKHFIENIKRQYERDFEGKPIASLNYSDYKLVSTTGERRPFERAVFDRRRRLCLLQILAVYSDDYLSPLEDILSAVCEEYTWVFPAHNFHEEDMSFDYSEVDLVSAETGLALSETMYVFGDKLSSDIRVRIKNELYRRIVVNFEKRKFVFDELENNWAAVCGAGVAATYLYAFPERFKGAVKDRLFGLMRAFLNGLGEDGFCYEGVAYWQYGFSYFTIFFDVYCNVTGEYPEMLNEPKVLSAVNFVTDSHLDGLKYLPYGDGGSREFRTDVALMSAIKNVFGDKFIDPGCDLERDITSRVHGFRLINAVKLFDKNPTKNAQVKSKYFKSADVMVYKTDKYAFTAQCGNNGYSHSHNDVGVFEIVKNDKRLISDLGAGLYTWGYFNDFSVRYGKEVFVCGSWSHSVPIVDDTPQKEEADYYGKVLNVSEDSFKMDIAKAYPIDIKSLTVEYQLSNDAVGVVYEFNDDKARQITYRFVSDFEPKIVGDRVVIEELELTCGKNIKPVIEKHEYLASLGIQNVAYTVDFAIDKTTNDKTEFKFLIKK